MSTENLLEKPVPPSFDFMSLLVERYGPFAFGVVLLLIVWQMVAMPQIESARIDFNQQQRLVTELGELMNGFKIVGEHQRQTAEVLQKTTELLVKATDKLADRNN